MFWKDVDKVEFEGSEITKFSHAGDRKEYFIKGSDKAFYEGYLELVPEESEFKYGESIEVSNNNENWYKRMFIAKSNSGAYMGIDYSDPSGFVNGYTYTVWFYKYARKISLKLTRKEIAEKFWISEDFILVN